MERLFEFFAATDIVALLPQDFGVLNQSQAGGLALQRQGIGITGAGIKGFIRRLQGMAVIGSGHELPGRRHSVQIILADQVGGDKTVLIGLDIDRQLHRLVAGTLQGEVPVAGQQFRQRERGFAQNSSIIRRDDGRPGWRGGKYRLAIMKIQLGAGVCVRPYRQRIRALMAMMRGGQLVNSRRQSVHRGRQISVGNPLAVCVLHLKRGVRLVAAQLQSAEMRGDGA